MMINLLRKFKKQINLLLGREFRFPIQTKISHKWFGNWYGGFFVADKLLGEKSIIYSFGIGEDISFDTEILSVYKCNVYGFDPTPKSIQWIKNQNNLPERFYFHDFGIDARDGNVTFYLPENNEYVSGTLINKKEMKPEGILVPMKCLKTICTQLNHIKIDVLKMDIEGAEFMVIPDILKSGIKINQILIEFHHRFFEDGFGKTRQLISKLNESGYKIFAVSDSLDEVSFVHESIINS